MEIRKRREYEEESRGKSVSFAAVKEAILNTFIEKLKQKIEEEKRSE